MAALALLIVPCAFYAVGEVQGLQQQLESISDRLISGLDQLEGVSSSSMRRLEEQADTLVDAVAVSSQW